MSELTMILAAAAPVGVYALLVARRRADMHWEMEQRRKFAEAMERREMREHR